MRVAVAQLCPTTDREVNLARTAAVLDRAAHADVKLVVLPELFSVPFVGSTPDTSYFSLAEPIDGPSNALVARKAKEHGLVVVSSIFESAMVPGTFHNTACVYQGAARLAIYRKSHLPFSHGFPEKFYFTPGQHEPVVVPTSIGRLGVIICYERHFPELARATALSGAEILCIPVASASASMGDVFHLELRAHAVFNGMFVACANRVGLEGDKRYFGGSVICGPDGQVLALGSDDEKDEIVVADCDVDLLQETRIDRPFLRDRRPELYGRLSE